MPSKDNKYTDPELRNEVKEDIQAGAKGGAPGQWSARKAQMMASEYKKRGGGYTTDKEDKDEKQKHLDQWTEEDWQTKDGSGTAKKHDGTEMRYLPKKAWEEMTEEEKDDTDAKKQQGSKQGKQHVSNTGVAKDARKKASGEDGGDSSQEEGGHRKNSEQPKDCRDWDSPEHMERNQREFKLFQEQNRKQSSESATGHDQSESDGGDDEETGGKGKKRGRGANAGGASKKQKSSSRQDEPKGMAGDKTRVPEKGQQVQWKALPGLVDGEVIEVVYEEKTIDGKKIKGSKEDPRIALRSASSGKTCVHKPEAVYF